MSIFGNETEMTGMRLGPEVETATNDGFDAFGKPVPFYRRAVADQHLKDMGLKDTEVRFFLVNQMADAIERDEPHAAMAAAFKVLDLTGTYRLLAVLCCATPREVRS